MKNKSSIALYPALHGLALCDCALYHGRFDPRSRIFVLALRRCGEKRRKLPCFLLDQRQYPEGSSLAANKRA
jgi:hypothetical protein